MVRRAGLDPGAGPSEAVPKLAHLRRVSVARQFPVCLKKRGAPGESMPSSRPCSGPMGIPGPGHPGWTCAGAGAGALVCVSHDNGGLMPPCLLLSPHSGRRLIVTPHAPCRVRRSNLPDISGRVAVDHAGRRRLLGLSVAVVLGPGNAARRLARAVRSPSADDGSEPLGH